MTSYEVNVKMKASCDLFAENMVCSCLPTFSFAMPLQGAFSWSP